MTDSSANVIVQHPVDRAQVIGNWIWDRDERTPEEMVVVLFRRRFNASELGAEPALRISADSRYRAYLNGELISRGPCRGTLEYYNYETVSLEGRLVEGENVLAVEVRWYGRHYPQAEVHQLPGLWAMIGDADNPARILTDSKWKAFRTDAYAADPIPAPRPMACYCVVDPCEDVDYRQLPIDWIAPTFADDSWSAAEIGPGVYGRYQELNHTHWYRELAPRRIPPMEETPIAPIGATEWGTLAPTSDPHRVRSIEGELRPSEAELPTAFWADPAEAITLDGKGTHYVILNMGELVTGYPRLTVDAPSGTMVEFRYSEALSRNLKKAVRDDPAAGTVEGYFDTFTCRSGETTVEPFVWRTWRFLRIAVHHPDGPATLRNLDTIFTGYPFAQAAAFESPEPLHKQLWDISWRTARLCAHEHYEDCPYYEQLQYVSDTRLQALISYTVAGDFRLARQALAQWSESRRADGITKSRQPSAAAQLQVIPQFSLMWIGFLEDFITHSGDLNFAREHWACVEGVLAWCEQFETDDLCEDAPYWLFTDWSYPRENRYCGSIGEFNLRRVSALRSASRMANLLGKADRQSAFDAKADRIAAAVRERLYDAERGLFCDELDGKIIGEHCSLMAILEEVVTGDEAVALLDRVEADDSLARTTIYYSYYTFRAYDKLGQFDRVLAGRMYNWTDQLALHASTWFETPGDSRSDCHAWGAWIMCELLTGILGVTPASPGYETVRIAPHLGDLPWARGTVPTVHGPIRVDLARNADALACTITLPAAVTGTLVAPDGTEHALTSGENKLTI